jgi:hypothetical protein
MKAPPRSLRCLGFDALHLGNDRRHQERSLIWASLTRSGHLPEPIADAEAAHQLKALAMPAAGAASALAPAAGAPGSTDARQQMQGATATRTARLTPPGGLAATLVATPPAAAGTAGRARWQAGAPQAVLHASGLPGHQLPSWTAPSARLVSLAATAGALDPHPGVESMPGGGKGAGASPAASQHQPTASDFFVEEISTTLRTEAPNRISDCDFHNVSGSRGVRSASIRSLNCADRITPDENFAIDPEKDCESRTNRAQKLSLSQPRAKNVAAIATNCAAH